MKWLRLQLFRWAFKGCKVDDPDMLAYVKEVTEAKSLENELRIERALMLDYYAKRLRK